MLAGKWVPRWHGWVVWFATMLVSLFQLNEQLWSIQCVISGGNGSFGGMQVCKSERSPTYHCGIWLKEVIGCLETNLEDGNWEIYPILRLTVDSKTAFQVCSSVFSLFPCSLVSSLLVYFAALIKSNQPNNTARIESMQKFRRFVFTNWGMPIKLD